MLAVFLPPYPFRGIRAPYLWVFYRLLSAFKHKTLFITGEEYLLPALEWQADGRWELEPATMANLGYQPPSDDTLQIHEYALLGNEWFEQELATLSFNPLALFKRFLTITIPALEQELYSILSGQSQKPEAILSICNCPSLNNAAQALGIPVIHIEVGPLRAPLYHSTGYVDFSGVNGNSEAERRYLAVADDCQTNLNMDELNRYMAEFMPLPEAVPEFSQGLVMQVEDDSNLIAYSNDFDNRALISYAQVTAPEASLLVRAHPGSLFQLKPKGIELDNSHSSLAFIRRCKKILTVNSSVGLEAILNGIDTRIMGDSSYCFINEVNDPQLRANRAAFYLFGYLVPFSLLFDEDYLHFRLSMPTEMEIIAYHFAIYAADNRNPLAEVCGRLGEFINNEVKQANTSKSQFLPTLGELTGEAPPEPEITVDPEPAGITDNGQVLDLDSADSAESEVIINVESADITELEATLNVKSATTAESDARLEPELELILEPKPDPEPGSELELKLKSQLGLEPKLQPTEDQADLEAINQWQKRRLAQHEAEYRQIDTDFQVQQAERLRLAAEVAALRSSLSWRVTMPLRMFGRVFRGEWHVIQSLVEQRYPNSKKKAALDIWVKGWAALRQHPHPVRALAQKSRTAGRLILKGQFSELIGGVTRITRNMANTPAPLNNIDKSDIVVLASRHTLYVAHRVERSLREAGFGVTISHTYSPQADDGQLHIVICPQMFPELPKLYAAFQMEQSINPRWFTKEYFAILDRAVAIFDYSLTNIDFLLQQGVPYQKLFYMPISSYDQYAKHLISTGYQLNKKEKPIDVLFYGDPNCERRRHYLQYLGQRFNVHIASEVFGADLTRLVQQAKLVINVHYYENALLETTRLYETLSLGTPIVSEESSDFEQHKNLHQLIDFAPIGDVEAMAEKIEQLLNNKAHYRQRRQDIATFCQQDRQFDDYFQRYLLANDLIKFVDYHQKVSPLPQENAAITKYCLSLTETPVRKQAFLSKPTQGFEVVEGVRHRIGWIGCGMSYKHMLLTLAERKAKMAMICEDDVLFPADFSKKLEKVVAHLNETDAKWHVFAGIIAHLHDDTEILAVKQIDGIEYVYINRMTSMVMNIYSPRGIELISRWDESNIDSATNTIDRYLESAPGLMVITTLPFMVEYAEDQHSTLWGFGNQQYTSLIQSSERLLQEKVAAFKARQNTEVEDATLIP